MGLMTEVWRVLKSDILTLRKLNLNSLPHGSHIFHYTLAHGTEHGRNTITLFYYYTITLLHYYTL